jgi:endonuclease/exonuclease/phosphatase family metal-dependent hydrolase
LPSVDSEPMDGLRLALLALLLACALPASPVEFRAMTWNIWHGGKEDGADIGPERVVEAIRESGADLVAMQETYGSGERIAKALGFHFHPRGTNVSILSRYPVIEDLSVFEEFKCVGALVELPGRARVAFYSVWLPYSGEIWEEGTRDVSKVQSLLDACRASEPDARAILDAIDARLADPKYAGVPVVIAGDFNSMSHLDYTAVARDQYGVEVAWPTSRVMTGRGWRDAYRERNPDVDRLRNRTWTPRFPRQEQDRIDFVYYRGRGLEATSAAMLDRHQVLWPSDHAAVVASFRFDPLAEPLEEVRLRVAAYNIRHGAGMDDRLDLDRTAKAIAALDADVIGLQEVDLGVARSGGVNQPRELGRRLGMHPAFGSFMDYGGGRYGLAVLSRWPLVDVRAVRLPDGNEPRVALLVEVRLPSGETLTVVNVHLDWVEDDGFRFAQGQALANELAGLSGPYVLLGDFNDVPSSRTLALFLASARAAEKPVEARFTWDAERPSTEIDHVLVSPPKRWRVERVEVVPERSASDHRPVVADLVLRKG